MFAQCGEQVGVFGKALHQDLARAIERHLGVWHTGMIDAVGGLERLAQIGGGSRVGIELRVAQQRIG